MNTKKIRVRVLIVSLVALTFNLVNACGDGNDDDLLTPAGQVPTTLALRPSQSDGDVLEEDPDSDVLEEDPDGDALNLHDATNNASSLEDVDSSEKTEDELAAMDALALVFDLYADFVDKAPHIEDAESLESAVGKFTETTRIMNWAMDITGVTVDSDTARVVLDAVLGETAFLEGAEIELTLVDNTWMIKRDHYCEFIRSIGTLCPAADVKFSVPTEEESVVMDAVALIFDPEAEFATKVPHIEDAESLETAALEFTARANGMKLFIEVREASVDVDSDTALVILDVILDGGLFQENLEIELTLVDDIWVIARDHYCDLIFSLGGACPDGGKEIPGEDADGGETLDEEIPGENPDEGETLDEEIPGENPDEGETLDEEILEEEIPDGQTTQTATDG